jgi:hypothetical protein
MAETEQPRALLHHLNLLDISYQPACAGAVGSLLHVLPYLGRALGLKGLACLAATCRQLKQECVTFVNHNACLLLLDSLPPVKPMECLKAAAEAAAAVPRGALPPREAAADQCLQPVLWLLQVTPHSATAALAAADVLQRLVHLPHVPLQQAQQLVAAGVRISYAQLLAAASSMVAGVEVWVQAQQQLDVTSEVPAAVVAICCHQDWVSLLSTAFASLVTNRDGCTEPKQSVRRLYASQLLASGQLLGALACMHSNLPHCQVIFQSDTLPHMRVAVPFLLLLLLPLLQSDVLLLPALLAADAADLLQLAINCSCSIVMPAFGRFPSQLDPAAARRLLLTAAVRHRADMAMSVAAQAAVQQHLDAATMSAALGLLLPRASTRHAGMVIAMLLHDQQAVVQQMEGAALAEVLHAALKSREHIAR